MVTPMEEQTPRREEWQRLYETAIKVKQLEPWTWMSEIDMFAVQSPDTGQLGFVSVMGGAGEHFGVSVYLGSDGLEGFLLMQEAQGLVSPEVLFMVPQIQASFEDRELLTSEDKAVIKSLGLKFRGRNAWPWFRSMRPGFAPWYLEAAETRFLAHALQQLLDVAPRFAMDDSLVLVRSDNAILVRKPNSTARGVVWEDSYQQVMPDNKDSSAFEVDSEVLEHVVNMPAQKLTIEMDIFMMPVPVREGKGRPFFVFNLLLVEGKSGYVIGTEMMYVETTLEEMWTRVPETVLRQFARSNVKPAVIKTRPGPLHDFLAPIANKIGVSLQTSRRLRYLNEARESLFRFLG